MKKLIKKSIVLALLFTALQGNANVNPRLQNLKDGRTTVLTLYGVDEGDMLYIKDLFGQVLYEYVLPNSKELTKAFNLTVLKEGAYYFEFNNNNEVKRAPFKVANNKIVVNSVKASVIKNQAKSLDKSKLLKTKPTKEDKPVKLEKGVYRRIPSFKGQDFINYYKLNQ